MSFEILRTKSLEELVKQPVKNLDRELKPGEGIVKSESSVSLIKDETFLIGGENGIRGRYEEFIPGGDGLSPAADFLLSKAGCSVREKNFLKSIFLAYRRFDFRGNFKDTLQSLMQVDQALQALDSGPGVLTPSLEALGEKYVSGARQYYRIKVEEISECSIVEVVTFLHHRFPEEYRARLKERDRQFPLGTQFNVRAVERSSDQVSRIDVLGSSFLYLPEEVKLVGTCLPRLDLLAFKRCVGDFQRMIQEYVGGSKSKSVDLLGP